MTERSTCDIGDLFELISNKNGGNVSMKHICKVLYNLSVFIKIFDLR